MPRTCTVCDHPRRPAIEAALSESGQGSIRGLADRFGVTKSSLWRHRTFHSTSAPAGGPAAGEPAARPRMARGSTETPGPAARGGIERIPEAANGRARQDGQGDDGMAQARKAEKTGKAGTEQVAEPQAPQSGLERVKQNVAAAEAAVASADGQVAVLRRELFAAISDLEQLEATVSGCADLVALRDLMHRLAERRGAVVELRTALTAAEHGVARPAAGRLENARDEQRYLERHIQSVRGNLASEERLVATARKTLAAAEAQAKVLIENGAPRIAALRKQLAVLTGEGVGGAQ